MFSVRVPVVDINLQGSVVVPVTHVHNLDAERLPGGVQIVLDDLALVDDRKLPEKKQVTAIDQIF